MKDTILHISKYYHPYFGGIETLVKSLAEGMTDYNNVIVCYSTEGKYSKEVINGITVYRVKVNVSLMSQDISIGYYKTLKRLMEEYKPKYVHVHCPNPYVYPIVLKIIHPETKLILHWHADILSKGIVYNLVKPLEKQVLERADLIIATSPNYIHPSSPIYSYRTKIDIVQNGIISSDFDLLPGEEEHVKEIKKRYGGKKLVLFIGRHIPYKGIDWLLEIEKRTKEDCHFIIIGEGPLTRMLKKKCTSTRVTFTGKLSIEELRCYSHAADIFSFTSNTKAEAFGIALAEAMYCGCVPVVFTLEGSGVNWVSINGKTGIEVPLGDLDAYAKAIDFLLSHPAEREKFAIACRQRVIDMFTDKKAVSKMIEVYKRFQ